LESWATDPGTGLPYELFLFISRLVPMVNVDLLISDDQGRLLLTWRDDEIHGTGWHVPGGMIRFKETAAERIRATALEELGADVTFDETPIVEQIIEPIRQNRGHHVALLYRCRLLSAPDQTRRFTPQQPMLGHWAWHATYPENMIAAHKQYRKYFSEPATAASPSPLSHAE
jgi:ADP-ribose pyrophosphatase YjhB (NUDIX family)